MNSYRTGTLIIGAIGIGLALIAAFGGQWARGRKRHGTQRDRWEAIGYVTLGAASMAFAAAHPTPQALILALAGNSLAILKAERLTETK